MLNINSPDGHKNMKKTKITELPAEVLEKVKVINNVFEEAEQPLDRFETVVNKLNIVLTDKYNISPEQWNKDIAPILRLFIKK